MLTNDDAREAWIDVTLDCDWENPSETGEAPDLAPWPWAERWLSAQSAPAWRWETWSQTFSSAWLCYDGVVGTR